jgi:hypothetical protein
MSTSAHADGETAAPIGESIAEMMGRLRPTPEMFARAEAEERRAKADVERRADADRARAVAASIATLPGRYRDLMLGGPELAARIVSRTAIAATHRAVDATQVVWTGLSGSGKTSLACAAARARIEANGGGSVMFVRAGQLATASRYHALGQGAPRVIQDAISVDLLVLDELGGDTRVSQWQDVDDVIFARYEQGRPLWITTWMSPDEMAKKYSEGLARRVFERAVTVACGGTK